jgi:hypothetical protein
LEKRDRVLVSRRTGAGVLVYYKKEIELQCPGKQEQEF